VVSADCAARRCSARHALAGVAIATMTSLRHRSTTDSGTDVTTLVRRALAEVCTVPVLLVLTAATYDRWTVKSKYWLKRAGIMGVTCLPSGGR